MPMNETRSIRAPRGYRPTSTGCWSDDARHAAIALGGTQDVLQHRTSEQEKSDLGATSTPAGAESIGGGRWLVGQSALAVAPALSGACPIPGAGAVARIRRGSHLSCHSPRAHSMHGDQHQARAPTQLDNLQGWSAGPYSTLGLRICTCPRFGARSLLAYP